MGILYLAALIVGAGTIALQLVFAGKGDIDADADADLSVDADVDADLDADADADVDGGHDAHVHADGGFLPIFLSLRFWTFAFLAFGMVGTLLHYLSLASLVATPIIAGIMGLGSGFLASWTFRFLSRQEMSSDASPRDAVGQVGRVLVRVEKGNRGKVRIELKGQSLDMLATTDEEEELAYGDWVLVEQVDGATARVSKAPEEFLPPKLSGKKD